MNLRTSTLPDDYLWQKPKNKHAAFGAYSYEYGYDNGGNRTSLSIEAVEATREISVDWIYKYDANGNLTQTMKEEKASGTWDEKLRWEYEWNPRDQVGTGESPFFWQFTSNSL